RSATTSAWSTTTAAARAARAAPRPTPASPTSWRRRAARPAPAGRACAIRRSSPPRRATRSAATAPCARGADMSDPTPRPRSPQELDDRSLAEVVRGRSRAAEASEALAELVRRRRAGAPLLREVVRDAARPAELRASAAVALGRTRDAEARRALVEALRDRDPSVLRRAAESLGKIGDREDLAQLECVQAPRGPAQRSLHLPRALISSRPR